MKRNANIIILSAASLLVVALVIVLIRRRGRKVYVKEPYRLNNNYQVRVHPESDWSNFLFYEGTLDYVVVPRNAQTLESDGSTYIQVSAIGELGTDGKIRRMSLTGKNFVDTRYLNLKN